jgi:flavin reductase (DIM6/NTAB) family NADH-FMN oxidoreductase RutF
MTGAQAGTVGLPRDGTGQAGQRSQQAQSERDSLRTVLGHFATGVTVLAAGRDTPHGMNANSFTSVSPPLVLVCLMRTAAIHQAVLDCQSFSSRCSQRPRNTWRATS